MFRKQLPEKFLSLFPQKMKFLQEHEQNLNLTFRELKLNRLKFLPKIKIFLKELQSTGTK